MTSLSNASSGNGQPIFLPGFPPKAAAQLDPVPKSRPDPEPEPQREPEIGSSGESTRRRKALYTRLSLTRWEDSPAHAAPEASSSEEEESGDEDYKEEEDDGFEEDWDLDATVIALVDESVSEILEIEDGFSDHPDLSSGSDSDSLEDADWIMIDHDLQPPPAEYIGTWEPVFGPYRREKYTFEALNPLSSPNRGHLSRRVD